MTRRLLHALLPPLVPLLAVTLSAELAVRAGWIAPYLLPAPSSVLATLVRDADDLLGAAGRTSLAAVAGFALSALCGLLIAMLLVSSRRVQRALYPYAVFFQTVPIIAIAPLLVIWFGLGTPTVIASAFIASIFPVIANALTGLLSTDPALRDLFRLYGASPIDSMVKLRLPSALPSILTGLRVAAGLAVIGAVVGEFVGGGGLGSVVETAKTQQRTDKVFAAVLLASLLGLVLFAAVNLVSRFTLRHWHASESA